MHSFTTKGLPAILAFALAAGGCDDGRIYPPDASVRTEEGFSVRLNADISGAGGNYGADYFLALAAFEEGSDFAAVSKNVGDAATETELSNVPLSVARVELCVLGRLRQRVFTLATLDVAPSSGDVVTLDAGTVDARPFSVVERGVFEVSCSRCHGAAGHAAASLDLSPEKAYAMLVGVPSVVEEGVARVEPGAPAASTLWQALATEVSSGWAFSHSNLLDAEKTGFIEYWIIKGAER